MIVVDNGGAELGDEQALVVDAGGNLGYAGGAALGASKASGDVLVFLNQDTVVEPARSRRSRGRSRTPASGSRWRGCACSTAPELLNSGGTVVHLSGIAWAGRFGEPAEEPRQRARTCPPRAGRRWRSGARLSDELGGFSPRAVHVPRGPRARLARAAARPARRRRARPPTCSTSTSSRRNPDKLALLERNRLVFVLSAYSLRLLLLLGPVLFAVELAMLGLSTRQRWLGGKVRGYGWLLARPRWLLRHRRETQRLRRVRDRELVRFLTPILDPRMIELPRGAGAFNGAVQRYWRVVERLL